MTVKKNADRWWSAFVFAFLLAVYWTRRSLSFGAGDSPQHVLSALTWGVSWPPGYPLYTALAHFFSRLPLGSAASLVDGFSGLCHAAAAAVFFLVLRRLKASAPAALAATGFMAFSPLYWYYSEVAEVRAMNDLLAVLAAACALRWTDTRKAGWLYALGAAVGLGLSHHPTYPLILPALAWWLWRGGLPGRARLLVFAGVAALACALPYVVLGIRLHVSPPVYNPMGLTSWSDVLALFLRKNLGGPLRMVGGRGFFDLGGFAWHPLLVQAGWLLDSAWREPGAAGAGLAALGAWTLYRRQRDVFVFGALWAGASLGAFLFISSQQLHLHDPDYARAIAMRFYLMPFLALYAAAAFGADWACRRAPRLAWAAAALACLPLLTGGIDLRGQDPLLRYGEDILASSAPGDMIILSSDDAVLAMNYLDYVGGRAQGRVFLNPVLFAFKPYVRDLMKRYPELKLPPIGAAGLPADWHQWLALNPERRLYSEAMFLQILSRDFKGLSPHGVLIAVSDQPASRAQLEADARSYRETASLAQVSPRTIRPWTQEIYLARTAGLLEEWRACLLDPGGCAPSAH